jgi:hypothetical protein
MFELQDLWAKAYLRQGGQWGWFHCTDPDDPWGRQVLASTDDPRQCSQAGGRASRCGQLGSPSGLLEGGSAMTGLVEHSGREWRLTPLGLERTRTGIYRDPPGSTVRYRYVQ